MKTGKGFSSSEMVTVRLKEMATPSSILAWRTLWTEEPGRLLSLGLQRVGHAYEARLAHMHAFCPERE